MEYDKNICPVVNVDGVIERGKQYDLDITLPEDNRNVIYGIVRDCYKDPVKDAVVKLIEVECKMGKDIRKPVSHTFTDDNGEFVFGPLCANRLYEVEIWVNNVKHAKICTECHRQGECLKGVARKTTGNQESQENLAMKSHVAIEIQKHHQNNNLAEN